MEFLLPFCLTMQVVLAILAPGFSVHGRTVFVSDFWVFVTLGALALESYRIDWRLDRRLALKITGLSLLFFCLFLHGKYRVPLPENLTVSGKTEPGQFNAAHEFIMMIRYLSWVLEAAWLWSLLVTMNASRRAELQTTMRRALFGITIIAGALTILSGLNASFLAFLGHLYGYSESLHTWAYRGFGSFQSPLEAGLTLTLCGFLALSPPEPRGRREIFIRRFTVSIAAAGTLLSRTMTAVVSALGAVFLYRFKRLRLSMRIAVVGGTVAAAAVVGGLAPDFLALKWADLVSRVQPWVTLFHLVTSRWDQIFLGIGFYPVNVDNAYLFLLFKLGLIGAGVVSFLALQWARKAWMGWTDSQRAMILYLLISGLALDTFIIRPVVMVFIAVGLPLLAPTIAIEVNEGRTGE